MPSSPFVSSVRPAVANVVARNPGGAEPQMALDADALARLGELDPKGEMHLIERVLKTFQSSAIKFTAQLEAARASGDRAAIRRVAHTLKSSSGYIGAVQLARCCAELEAASDRAEQVDLAAGIDAMTTALALTLGAVSRRLGA